MKLLLNRKINHIVVLDPEDGHEIMIMNKEDAVDLATRILNLAGQIIGDPQEEAEDE